MSDDMNFNDPDLRRFRQQFVDHKQDFVDHVEQEDKRFAELLVAQERNTSAIDRLINETRTLVQLQHDLQGAYEVGVNIQNFGLWLVKWPLIGTGLYAAYTWVMKHIV